MRTVAEIERAYERVDWALRLGMRSAKCGQWTCLLAMIESFAELLVPRRLQPLLSARLWAPLIIAGVLFTLVGTLMLAPVMVHRRRLAEEWRLARMRKSCPPGCTCIFGALTDNPSCPHHRSTL